MINSYLSYMTNKILFILSISTICLAGCDSGGNVESPPNFLLLLSDNHYFEHLSCYGDPVVRTPNIDKIASTGVRFAHAFCGAPSCTPARAALLSGREIWELGEGANLWSTLADSITTYVDVLERAGYFVGHDRKGWGPGNYEAGGRSRNPAGYTFKDFATFLAEKRGNQPWSFFLSSRNPHRPFEHGKGIKSGLDPSEVVVPTYLPDVPEVRSDICDYYHQIEAFDQEVSEAIALLQSNGGFDNTVIVICGDNGWMMPRGLANLYDFGTRVPLIISCPTRFKGGRVVSDLVSLNDLAPTILELAEEKVPEAYSATSLLPMLLSEESGRTSYSRSFLCMGRERHALARADGLGYPGRAIRTDKYLLIKNYAPERWPAGDPPLFGDIDLHMLQDKSPTKEYMMLHKDRDDVEPLYHAAFEKRPEEELFDLVKDPFQMNNLANDVGFSEIKNQLLDQMNEYLLSTNDPRLLGLGAHWDTQKYYKDNDWIATPRKEAQERFGLQESYDYHID